MFMKNRYQNVCLKFLCDAKLLYFMLKKIIEKKKHMHKMYNTSSSSYQTICLIKVNVKIIIITVIIIVIISKIKYISK